MLWKESADHVASSGLLCVIFATCVAFLVFLVGHSLGIGPAVALYLLGISLITYAIYLKQNE